VSVCRHIWLLAAVCAWMLLPEVAAGGQAGSPVVDVEVPEASSAVAVPGAGPPSVRYAVVHHKRPEDRSGLSEWLRAHESTEVSFKTSEGNWHQVVLRRLKHCFGRGILLYADSVSLHEKDVVQLQFPGGDDHKTR